MTLGRRLGKTTHVSPLEMRVRGLVASHPIASADSREDWLLEVANQRGVTAVARPNPMTEWKEAPPAEIISNEELASAILLLQREDQPQLLRAAAQLISRGVVDPRKLLALAERERFGPVLKAVARQALRVDPDHEIWQILGNELAEEPDLTEPVIHWTRLAEPRMGPRGVNAESWDLVS